MLVTSEYLLRQPCDPVEANEYPDIVSKLRYRLRKINEKAKSSDIFGVGLAANQIGIHKQVSIVSIPFKQIDVTLVNPVIVGHSTETALSVEGCLSFPGETFQTKRFLWVAVQCHGWKEPRVFEGLVGVVVQHEIAHLYGLLPQDFSQPIEPSEWTNEAHRIRTERFDTQGSATANA